MNFDEVIERKGTSCLKYDFAKERRKPDEVMPFWVADMDFRAPESVLNKLHEIVDHGVFGYTDVKKTYNDAVVNWFAAQHHRVVEPEWIVQTPGIVYALAAVIRSLTAVNDAVLVMTPVYYPFFEVIEENQRVMIESQLIEKETVYSLDFQDIQEKIRKHKIKMILLCNPHNPIGRVWSFSELQQLVDIAKENKCIIISDEIHMDFVFAPHEHHSLIDFDRTYDQWVVCTSASKTFNLAGLQLSNIIIRNEPLRKALLQEKRRTGYSQPNLFGVMATQAAYESGYEWLQQLKTYLYDNYQFTVEFLKSRLPDIRVSPLEGTYLLWLDFRNYQLRDEQINHILLAEAQLWFDEGSLFGSGGSGFQRINIATSRIRLEEALQKLAAAFIKENTEI